MAKKKKKDNKKQVKNNKALNIIIIIALIIVGIMLYARYVETTGLNVKEYRVASKTLPSNFSGIKIVHISDIHYGSTTFEKDLKVIVDRINELKPDLVVFTGDLLDNTVDLKEKDLTIITNYLNNIEANLGKYSVKGNWDVKNKKYDFVMKNTDFIELNNTYDLIYNEGLTPIYLAGTTSSMRDTIDYDKVFKYYKSKKEDAYTPKYKIILTHEPDNAVDIMNFDENVNLILSGHSHNGQITIPFYGGIILPEGAKKYNGPHYKIKNTDIYISSGIGTSTIKYRLFNKPSFNFYRLKALK